MVYYREGWEQAFTAILIMFLCDEKIVLTLTGFISNQCDIWSVEEESYSNHKLEMFIIRTINANENTIRQANVVFCFGFLIKTLRDAYLPQTRLVEKTEYVRERQVGN